MTGKISHDFAGSHRMADQDDIRKIEAVDQAGEVVGEPVVVVAVLRLARPAVAAPIVGDGAPAALGQPVELSAPDRRAQCPAMDEHHRTAGADILVEKLLAVRRFYKAICGGDEGLIIHQHLHRRSAR
jgi:hypothetical protein